MQEKLLVEACSLQPQVKVIILKFYMQAIQQVIRQKKGSEVFKIRLHASDERMKFVNFAFCFQCLYESVGTVDCA